VDHKHGDNSEEVVQNEDLVQAGEETRVHIDRDQGKEGSHEVNEAPGPPDLEHITEALAHID
jgi:hypothetical protein